MSIPTGTLTSATFMSLGTVVPYALRYLLPPQAPTEGRERRSMSIEQPALHASSELGITNKKPRSAG